MYLIHSQNASSIAGTGATWNTLFAQRVYGICLGYEDKTVEYFFGLAKNSRSKKATGAQMQQARLQYESAGEPVRVYADLRYRTRKS